MNEQVNQLVMNADLASMPEAGLDPAAEQLQRKQRLAAALRIFGKFGFDEGVAGHITVRDPIDTDTFWVNPMGRSFKLMRVSDLIRVSHEGDIVDRSKAVTLSPLSDWCALIGSLFLCLSFLSLASNVVCAYYDHDATSIYRTPDFNIHGAVSYFLSVNQPPHKHILNRTCINMKNIYS